MLAPALRPLSVGEMLDAAIKIVVRNFLTLVKAAGVVVIPTAALVGVIQGSVVVTSNQIVNPNTGQINTTQAQSVVGAAAAIALITYVAGLFAAAICYKVVGDAYIGGRPDWRVALRFTARRLGSVVWVAFVVAVFFALVLGVGILVVALVGQAVKPLAVVLGLGLFVVFVWLAIPAALAVPTFMMEGVKGSKAFRRAFALVRGQWWRCFGLLLLTLILAAVVTAIVDLVLGVGMRAALGGTTAGRVLVDVVLFAVTYFCVHPFEGAVLVVLSIDLRVRKEGYDVQLLASQLGVDPAGASLPYQRYVPGPGYPGSAGWPQWPPPGSPPPTYPPSGYPPGTVPPPPAYPPPTAPPSSGLFVTPGPPGPVAPPQPPSASPGAQGASAVPGAHPTGEPAPPGSPGSYWSPPRPATPGPGPGVPAVAGGPDASGPPGPGWWKASDGRWYPPELNQGATLPPEPGWWKASDGRWYPPEQHPSAGGDGGEGGGSGGTGGPGPAPGLPG